jgi:hypothetical protein
MEQWLCGDLCVYRIIFVKVDVIMQGKKLRK